MAELTTNTNLLQPSGFKVIIDRANYPNLEFFAQSIDHPGISGSLTEIPYKGTTLPMTVSSLTFDELTITILVDEDMNSYEEAVNWMIRMVNESEVGAIDAQKQAKAPHRGDIKVSVLTSSNNANKMITYKDAFPISIGAMSMAINEGETNYITVPITFKYTRFDIE
jgi:hypothetical protein